LGPVPFVFWLSATGNQTFETFPANKSAPLLDGTHRAQFLPLHLSSNVENLSIQTQQARKAMFDTTCFVSTNTCLLPAIEILKDFSFAQLSFSLLNSTVADLHAHTYILRATTWGIVGRAQAIEFNVARTIIH
jgi:hypothetical protein